LEFDAGNPENKKNIENSKEERVKACDIAIDDFIFSLF